jgi:hypothetical protein
MRKVFAKMIPKNLNDNRYTLQTVSGEALPILKEVFLTLTLGQRPLKIWIFITNITNEFILGLDILHAYDTSVDLGLQTLHLAEEPQPSSLSAQRSGDTCTM